MSRKTNSVTSSLQTLLRRDSDVSDAALTVSHLTKRIEVAINVLSTVPLLRSVALEALSSGFIYIFEQKEVKEDSAFYSSLSSACDLISSLLSRSPSGWSDSLFLWGLDLLARLSASRSSPQLKSTNEKIDYWTSKPLVKNVIDYVSTGVEHRVAEEKEVIECVMSVVKLHKTEMGWLLAHIIAQKPLVLTPKLFACSSSLSSLVVATMAQCLNLLVESYPRIVQESLLKMVHCITDTTTGGEGGRSSVHSLKLLTQLMLQSPRVLELTAGETLQAFTSQHIYDMMTSAVESGITDGGQEEGQGDEGEVLSGDEGEPMEHDGPQEISLLSSLSSLLLQLSGVDAVSALNLIVGGVVLCTDDKGMEEEEDGEINARAIAKGHLTKATKTLMSTVVTVLNKAVTSVLLSFPSPSSDPAPLNLALSLQGGLEHWTTLLAQSEGESLCEFLSQLVSCVGICSSEMEAAKVLSLFLRKSPTEKLPTFISLHSQYLLCHFGVTLSFLSESVAELRADSADLGQWCSNIYRLSTTDNNSSSSVKDGLCSCFVPVLSLLPLTTPTSAITLMSSLTSLVPNVVSSHTLSDSLTAVECLLDHFLLTRSTAAQEFISKGVMDPTNKEREYQLCLTRSLLSTLSRENKAIENFICSDIVSRITSKDMAGYLMHSDQSGSTQGQRKPPNLLSSNNHNVSFLRGSLLNTRQTQHSGNLQRRPTPEPQTDSKTTQHSPQSIAITHCNDHILWLISDVVGKSTDQIATLMMDTVAPNLVTPLGVWPEVDWSSGSSRQTIELHLSVKRKMDQYPILLSVLLLISTDPRGFVKCSSLIQSLFDTLILTWSKQRSCPASSYRNDLTTSEVIIQSISQAGWIPRPLCYVSELFESLTCEEVSHLMQLCYRYIKDNYRSILSGCQVPSELDDKTKQCLKGLMIRNIDKLGHVYHRFIITPSSSLK